MIDCVVPRTELRATLIRLMDLLRNPRPAAEPDSDGDGEALEIPESDDKAQPEDPPLQIG